MKCACFRGHGQTTCMHGCGAWYIQSVGSCDLSPPLLALLCTFQLMASIKTVLMEMLSTFDAKSRMSAKQLREQLHQGWPVSNSSVAMEQLGRELRDEMKQSLEVVRKRGGRGLGGGRSM